MQIIVKYFLILPYKRKKMKIDSPKEPQWLSRPNKWFKKQCNTIEFPKTGLKLEIKVYDSFSIQDLEKFQNIFKTRIEELLLPSQSTPLKEKEIEVTTQNSIQLTSTTTPCSSELPSRQTASPISEGADDVFEAEPTTKAPRKRKPRTTNEYRPSPLGILTPLRELADLIPKDGPAAKALREAIRDEGESQTRYNTRKSVRSTGQED